MPSPRARPSQYACTSSPGRSRLKSCVTLLQATGYGPGGSGGTANVVAASAAIPAASSAPPSAIRVHARRAARKGPGKRMFGTGLRLRISPPDGNLSGSDNIGGSEFRCRRPFFSNVVSCRNFGEPRLSQFDKRLRALTPGVLATLRRGIEKESLRVQPDGMLADTPHPKGLGSALTHPRITTDFSESQVELITGVHDSIGACLAELTELHQVVYREIGDELLWCASMPCKLPNEEQIPIGQYGSANIGRLKSVYRQGLAHRYGRRMQTISGIHYNFSLPEAAWSMLKGSDQDNGPLDAYQDRGYFALIRNFRRHSWLLLILHGASPAVCGSFLGKHPHTLTDWGTGTFIAPHGTSLRMGRLGYQSDAQASLAVSFNSLEGYAKSLHRSLTETYPPYEAIGISDGGEYRQLATTLLQIENEFYGKIRPKRRILRGERALRALGERGVEYVEVRCVDVNPFHPIGIGADEIRFMDIFLLHCLLRDSPNDSPREIAAISRNQHLAAERGRDPDLRLERDGQPAAPPNGAPCCCGNASRSPRRSMTRTAGARTGMCSPRPRMPSRTRQRCRRRGCCGKPNTTTASRSRASLSIIHSAIGARCLTSRSPAPWRTSIAGWPTNHWRNSARSRRRTPCRSKSTASSTWRRT